jgi:uncharacterized integral membrane protein
MVFAIMAGLGGLAFHARNKQEITLDYFVGSINIELSWVLVATLVSGTLCGIIAMTSSVVKLRREIRRLSRRSDKADRELSVLRSTALNDGR